MSYPYEGYADFIVENTVTEQELKENYPGGEIERFGYRYAILHYPLSEFSNKDYISRFGYSAVPKMFGLMDTSNIERVGVTRLQNQPALALRGQGCLVGFVDTGIDYTHPEFLLADGNSRIEAIWDQTLEGTPPNGQIFGVEYRKNQIDEALNSMNPYTIVPSRDTNGHGTFLAGITAGNANIENDFTGIATDSRIVMVKCIEAKEYLRDFFEIPQGATVYQENYIMQGVEYILSIARELRRPVSICIGMGTNQGGHDGKMVLEHYLNEISKIAGVAVSVAAGNEGNARKHYAGTVQNGDGTDEVEIKVERNVSGFTMELWGAVPSAYAVGIVAPGGQRYEPQLPFGNGKLEYSFVIEKTKVDLFYRVFEMQAGDYVVFFRFEAPSEGIWRVIIKPINSLDKKYNIWLPVDSLIGNRVSFLTPSPFVTLTSTATSENTIVVAALLLEWGTIRGNYSYMDGNDIRKLMILGADRDANLDFPNREWGFGLLDAYQIFQALAGL